MVSKGLTGAYEVVIPGWSEGPDLRCAIAHRGIPRFRARAARPGMTTSLRIPAARFARGCADRFAPTRGRRECRVLAAPAVSCARDGGRGAHEHTGTAGALRHPLRNGFTAYAALSPETNSFCLRHRRIDGVAHPVGLATP